MPVNLELEPLAFLVTESNFMVERYRIAHLYQPVNLLKNAILSQQTSIYHLLKSKCGSCSFNEMKPQNCPLLSLATTKDHFCLEDTLIITVCPKCHTETLEKGFVFSTPQVLFSYILNMDLEIKTSRKRIH